MPKEVVLNRDLALGDVVQLFDTGPYGDATVRQITETSVHLRRPYIHTADFSYTGGVCTYVGLEDLALPLCSEATILRVRRGDPLK